MDSEVILTMDENTLEEQEVTVPIVTMYYTYSAELPHFFTEE